MIDLRLSPGEAVVRWREKCRYRLAMLFRGGPLAPPGSGTGQLAPQFTARNQREFEEGVARTRFPDLSSHRDALLAGQTVRVWRTCLCCEAMTPMRVDLRGSYAGPDGERVLNLREGLVCAGCGLNNRQRLVAMLVRQVVSANPGADIWMMERVTPVFRWVRRSCAPNVQGSEYLGPQVQAGTHVRGVRHEDAMALSWPDCSFDLVVSNDVLEHVPDPVQALRECHRVLRPGGTMLATFPFHVSHTDTVTRARATADGIEHLLAPQYHGNPLSSAGSLVFQDFGWDFVDSMAEAGFDTSCEVYASDEFGHLGTGLLVFRLCRPVNHDSELTRRSTIM